MNFKVSKLDQPKKLCVICGQPPESCKQDNHILDSIAFTWVLTNKATNRPVSYHFASEDAAKALLHAQGTSG